MFASVSLFSFFYLSTDLHLVQRGAEYACMSTSTCILYILYEYKCEYIVKAGHGVGRAGKSTKFMYLSKSTSNSEKSYSSRSKSTPTKLYLKYK